MTFWQTSSQAQKLAQIDGAIECGMTARQVAVNLGTTRSTIISFALKHDRHFGRNIDGYKGAVKQQIARKMRLQGEYERDAFSIFQSPKNTTRILDMRIDDEEEAFA